MTAPAPTPAQTAAQTPTAPLRVLICDEMNPGNLDHEGFQIDYQGNLEREETLRRLPDYDALITRSRTKVDRELLDAAGPRLKVIGRGGVGVDNIDLEYASRRGLLVLNAPESNNVSAAELAVMHLMAAARGLTRSDRKTRAGEWDRKFLGLELTDKTLGIVGLGRIGSIVADRAQGLHMNVVAYDPYVPENKFERLGVQRAASLDELLGQVDALTVHTPLTDETRGMIGERELALLKRDAIVVNAARGGIIEEQALVNALHAGHLFAAGVDVFVDEPPTAEHIFLGAPNLGITAHLGANTREAQERVGAEIVSRVLDALHGDVSKGAVNAPALDAKTMEQLGGYLDLGEKLGRILAQLLPGAHEVEVTFRGEFPTDPSPVVTAVLMGYLSGSTDEHPNMINARALARERGVTLSVREEEDSPDYQTEVIVRVLNRSGEKERTRKVGGTVFGKSPRLTRLRDYRVELEPEGFILIASNLDKPGAVAKLSNLLGTWGINIAGMALGRSEKGGQALFTLTLDDSLTPEQLQAIRDLDVIESAFLVRV
ncbi:phosphoglycerate dehydrogenase [Deinococcus radiodurans]|jgi:D-3-phosphoglycerate dehydrogenase (EC 1.1.1.95)|uniref:D-3-phosphoglycerate dehydrogenase n=1 Tax=Deinococcus radiodurans (strain ATCC 13939 / DSM 20539 / JCM 16871 / CCUG 27074 / LMG 4051 / NBRC 15346 / NCIMB 9279 / VKM B-1422 / R1) TaxID=243230 RepID=Q9RUU0_DEIRA|nr:phosphoglycerate dehydrogenase [Deinococcus radiodurans]AAF10861.1 D-3-phosphoglycerate dehydrogenase [Deinococcus radiodurans R1 = ATCC 13939 = DSM 20539]ANC71551.1 3-phosphoglycerate dehydrogenase [Deinococcus radiodurans R1 = ATCC 13939 = DSM 20539]QEM70760.1 phosphoglycerate dehydrogenase [Deinococcus radiodurans]QIP29338.1 phosphoglycerate dehydrogenase [Deinococcus radiodurans]QIP31965.1 phosphoglycerate dehydrogenase [Deinococcus radiodurans]